MKIFMLTGELDCGGAETHIYTLAKALSDMGETVSVGSSGGRTAERLSCAGVKGFYAVIDAKRPFLTLYHSMRLYFFIKREGFDLLHGHTRPACFVLNVISRLTGIPLVTTVHAKFSLDPVYRRLSAWGSATVAVSEDLRGYVCENYRIDPENTRVIVNGIDREDFYADREGSKPLRIVFASRLDRDCSSAAFSLCRSAPRLVEAYPNVEIVICGGGDCLFPLSEMISSMDKTVRERITLAGWVEDMGKMLRSARLFVGVSRAAIEAMLCGIPVILAGDEGAIGLVDGMDKLLLGAETNFCCRGHSRIEDEVLLSHIQRALDMTDGQRAEIIFSVEEWVRANYGAEKMANETLDLYKGLVRTEQKGKRVLLCGYYGYGNIGDNALLRASVRRARERFKDGRISALTAHPHRDRVTFGITCVSRVDPFSIIRELLRSDALVFGGGTLLQDATSLRSFLYYALLIRTAAFFGCRVELWGNGLGDIRGRISLKILKRVLDDVDYIGLRDKRSVYFARDIVKNSRVIFERDLAESLIPSPDGRIDWLLKSLGLKREDRTERYAVIAVKGTADRESILCMEKYMTELLDAEMKFLYIPMFETEDRKESLRLRGAFGGIVAEHISESDVLGIMKRAAVVCAMRYHALVFASMAGVPYRAFGKDPKVREFDQARA